MTVATIYPDHLPESILNDPMRAAERIMYHALSRMGDAFTIFYSVAWQSRSLAGNVRDGEADFVIAHPELGMLVIEVKGGSIRFDGVSGQWYSGIHEIRDPVEQAKKSRYELLRKLQDLPGWGDTWMTTGHAVAFQDIVVGNTDLKLDLPHEIILDGSSLENIESEIRKIFNYYGSAGGKAGAPGRNRFEMIKKLLIRSFQIRTPLGDRKSVV